MKFVLTVIAIHGLFSRAEECDPKLFKSFSLSAEPTTPNCPTATFVGVQPAKVVCSGQTTKTTLVWTYTDCEPTACVPLPSGMPIPLDNFVDLGSGPKEGPPGVRNATSNNPNKPGSAGNPSNPGSDSTNTPGAPSPPGVLPNPAPPNSRFVATTRNFDFPPYPLDPTVTGPGTLVPFGTSSRQIPSPRTTGLLPISTDLDSRSINIITDSSNPTILPTSDGSITINFRSSVPFSSDPVPPEPTSSDLDISTDPVSLEPTSNGPDSSTDPVTPTITTTDPNPQPSTLSSTSTSSSSAAPTPTCSDLPNGNFPDGVLAPWYLSDQVTADSSNVIDSDGNSDHPYAFALIPSQSQRSQVYLNNYLPSCGDPPPQVTLQVSFDYQFTGNSEGCSIAVAVNRSPENLLTVTDEGVEAGVWQSYQGEPITVQLSYDPLFTVKLLCEGDTANEPAILITDIQAYA